MNSIYLDPGYKPEIFYPMLESLLLLFPRVYVYAPNQTDMEVVKRSRRTLGPSLDPSAFVQYARVGLLTPIAGKWYWDKVERDKKAESILKRGVGSPSSIKQAGRLQWTEFDDEICALPEHEKHSEDRMYELEEECAKLDQNFPEIYGQIERLVGQLPKKRLPEKFDADEFKNAPLDVVCKTVIRDFVMDAALCGFRNVTTQLFPERFGPLTALFAKLTTESKMVSKAPPLSVIADEEQEIRPAPDDFNAALRFAKELATKHDLDPARMRDYHNRDFSRCFTLWVQAVLRDPNVRGKDVVETLCKSFNAAKEDRRNTVGWIGTAVSSVVGATLSQFLSNPGTSEFLNEGLHRRGMLRGLMILGSVGFAAVAGPEMVKKVALPREQMRHEEWIALVANAPSRNL